jgi:hypothetical protein
MLRLRIAASAHRILNRTNHFCRHAGINARLVPIAAALAALATLFTLPAQAQSLPPFKLSATIDECKSCDVPTQQKIANEDDYHDSIDTGLDNQEEIENHRYQVVDRQIEQAPVSPTSDKPGALKNEEEIHRDSLAAIKRQRAIEAARHAQALAQILAGVGKTLAALTHPPAGASLAGPGAPNTNPPIAGNPAANNPPSTSAAPAGPLSGGASAANPGGGAVASNEHNTVPGQAVGNRQNADKRSIGQKLGDFVKAAARRAINGIPEALPYFARTSRPAAQNLEDQWTHQMTPAQAATMVGTAWLSNAAQAGASGSVGGFQSEMEAGSGLPASIRSATRAGVSQSVNRAAALASGGTAGGSIAEGGLGGAGGRLMTNASPGRRGVLVSRGDGAGGGGAGRPAPSGAPGPDEGGGPTNPLAGYLKVRFSNDIPEETQNALKEFNSGKLGASVKAISTRDLQSKTWQEVVKEIGAANGGWKPAGGGTFKAGKWTVSQKFAEPTAVSNIELSDPNKVPMIFIENADGGVIRIKPWGVPGGRYTSMQTPHFALYVKNSPSAGLDWPGEAFKVVDGAEIPKTPLQIDPPQGVPKWTPTAAKWAAANPRAISLPQGGNPNEYYSPEFENWLQQTGWANAGHQPMVKSWWSPNALAKLIRGAGGAS